MKPFYQIASWIIGDVYKHQEFVDNRKFWFNPKKGDPVLYCYTTVYHADKNYHAEVKAYRRNAIEQSAHLGAA